jgi:phenylalanine-4-hydroxylase
MSQSLDPPEGVKPDWTISQDWESYTAADHAMWDKLFEHQARLLPGRAVPEFIEGLDILRLDTPGIPDFEDLSRRLMKATGWQVVAAPGLVPDKVFFDHLANRRFVSGRFIRSAGQEGYLQEPDVFHDVFGHVPLLANPVFADYLQAYGKGGQRAAGLGSLVNLARLYWYTVEFGLIRSDEFQQTYFVINSFEDLLRKTQDTDFAPIYARLADGPALPADALISTDRVLTRGTQRYAFERARR